MKTTWIMFRTSTVVLEARIHRANGVTGGQWSLGFPSSRTRRHARVSPTSPLSRWTAVVASAARRSCSVGAPRPIWSGRFLRIGLQPTVLWTATATPHAGSRDDIWHEDASLLHERPA